MDGKEYLTKRGWEEDSGLWRCSTMPRKHYLTRSDAIVVQALQDADRLDLALAACEVALPVMKLVLKFLNSPEPTIEIADKLWADAFAARDQLRAVLEGETDGQ